MNTNTETRLSNTEGREFFYSQLLPHIVVVEINSSQMSWSFKSISCVQHPEVVVENEISRLKKKGVLMLWVTDNVRKAVVTAIPLLHTLEREYLRIHREIRISDLFQLPVFDSEQRPSLQTLEFLLLAMKGDRHFGERFECIVILPTKILNRLKSVDQLVLSSFVCWSDAMQQLHSRRVWDEGLIGVETHRSVGIAQLVDVGVGGVVESQVLHSTEMGGEWLSSWLQKVANDLFRVGPSSANDKTAKVGEPLFARFKILFAIRAILFVVDLQLLYVVRRGRDLVAGSGIIVRSQPLQSKGALVAIFPRDFEGFGFVTKRSSSRGDVEREL